MERMESKTRKTYHRPTKSQERTREMGRNEGTARPVRQSYRPTASREKTQEMGRNEDKTRPMRQSYRQTYRIAREDAGGGSERRYSQTSETITHRPTESQVRTREMGRNEDKARPVRRSYRQTHRIARQDTGDGSERRHRQTGRQDTSTGPPEMTREGEDDLE